MGGDIRVKMNHREKQQEILSQLSYEERSGEHTFSMCQCGRQGSRSSDCSKCLREEAKAHKEEVKKGCGNIFKHGKEGEQVGCVIGELCPTCQAIIDRYSENLKLKKGYGRSYGY